MKVLTVFAFALALAAATAADLYKEELKSRNIIVPVGRPEGRITRGQTAEEGQFPYQVGLSLQDYDGKLLVCGGSLLSNTKVLTAAHCTVGIEKGWVYLGSIRWQSAEVVQHFTSQDILIHPGWINKTLLINDISIITIPYTQYSNKIQPVQLPATRRCYSSYKGKEVIIAGWGKYSDVSTGGVLNLQYANRIVISHKICASHYMFSVSSANICTATFDGISACYGDSGGPMVLASTREQIGIFSFVPIRGCELGVPAVFTRVTRYLSWIKRNAGV